MALRRSRTETHKDIFIEADEARYYTKACQEAEREATEAYKRGCLPTFETVDELMDYINDSSTNPIHHI